MVVLQLEEQPPLVQAVFTGEIEEVKVLLDYRQDVNYQDSQKRSPLHAVAYKGDAGVAALLLSHGARVNSKDNKWLTPLHRACGTGSEEVVSLLLHYRGDTSARDRQWQTPLHIAAANNALGCVAQLLNCIPNPNVTDRSGRTALHHAAINGHNEVVELLISKGCIVNAYDKRDCRPLHCAAHLGHVETIELLLRNGADINARDRNQYTPLHVAAASDMVSACRMLLNGGAQVDACNAYGNTPLHIACLNGHLQICQELLQFDADFEAINYRGQTALHIAAASTHGVDCLNYLLEQKVNINKQSLDGRTPLHMTAIHGRFTRSKTLIDKGATIDCTDKNGCTALHISAMYGHDLLANTLLSFGADPAKKGFEGRTPLHMCCLSGYVECCRKFLQAGVDLNAQDDSGKTPLHCAAYKGSVECLDLLVSKGANFRIVDTIGRTPLHYAAVQGHFSCVFTLVGVGNPVNVRDNEGCSPLHLAAAYDKEGKCIEYLLQHKSDSKLSDLNRYTPIHYAVAGENYNGLTYLLSVVGNAYFMYGNNMPLTTPLHLAAKNGNMDVLQIILPYFHDTNIRTERGTTALSLAAKSGHAECVQLLLRFGAKVAICDNVNNMSPIHHSAKNGHVHCLALLLDNTEDRTIIDAKDHLQRTALMLAVSGKHNECVLALLKTGADPNIVDDDSHSSLFRAVICGHNNIVQLLVLQGALVGSRDVHQKTVLHLAAACGHIVNLQTLLSYMKEEEILALDQQDCTALHWACYNGNSNCVDYLLKKDVFKTLIGNPFSALHCAMFAGSEKCVELLCNYYGSAIVKLKDARSRTPLHIACLHGHVECCRFLLEKGAEIDCQDVDGKTPLIAAAHNGQSQIIEILIGHKADVTAYDCNGNTALHLACLKRHNHTALLLLEHISDPDIVNMINNDRRTSLHLAARNGLIDVTKHLLRKGSSVLAVDCDGFTPALCCAPNINVAKCLAIILANFPKPNSSKETQNPSLSQSKLRKIRKFKKDETTQTNHLLMDVIKKPREKIPCFIVENYNVDDAPFNRAEERKGAFDLHRSFSDMSIACDENNYKQRRIMRPQTRCKPRLAHRNSAENAANRNLLCKLGGIERKKMNFLADSITETVSEHANNTKFQIFSDQNETSKRNMHHMKFHEKRKPIVQSHKTVIDESPPKIVSRDSNAITEIFTNEAPWQDEGGPRREDSTVVSLKIIETTSNDDVVNVDSIMQQEQLLEEQRRKAETEKLRTLYRRNNATDLYTSEQILSQDSFKSSEDVGQFVEQLTEEKHKLGAQQNSDYSREYPTFWAVPGVNKLKNFSNLRLKASNNLTIENVGSYDSSSEINKFYEVGYDAGEAVKQIISGLISVCSVQETVGEKLPEDSFEVEERHVVVVCEEKFYEIESGDKIDAVEEIIQEIPPDETEIPPEMTNGEVFVRTEDGSSDNEFY